MSLRAAAALPVRLVRRGALVLCAVTAAYSALEVVSYRRTYPTAASRDELARFADDRAVRVLQGVPQAVDTVGGFVAWNAGWFLALVMSTWAALATTRLLRADEDSGRAELLLSRPLPASRLLLVQVSVLTAAVALSGAAVAVTLVALGLPTGGAVLLGAGLAGVGATAVAAAGVAAQLLDPRRRALAAAAVLLGLAFAQPSQHAQVRLMRVRGRVEGSGLDEDALHSLDGQLGCVEGLWTVVRPSEPKRQG